MRINHNIASLRALNQMHKSNYTLDKSLERLSSGKRINHAADDAAGLAISQKMDTQVRGLGQANRNAMDGISLIQTAEGALNEVHSMLQRIRELAVQVSNGTYDSSDRKAVQSEVDELLSEIERISTDTEFNERKLLNGNLDNRVFSSGNQIASSIFMSAGVKPGEYKFEVEEAATQASLETIVPTSGTFDAANKITLSGELIINNEKVSINKGDTNIEVLDKIRGLADKVGVDIDVTGEYGNGKVTGGVVTDGKITFKNKEYGNIEIKLEGDTALLDALGMKVPSGGVGTPGTPGNAKLTEGKDIKVKGGSLVKNGAAGTDPNINYFPSETTYISKGKYLSFKANNDFEFRVEGTGNTGVVTFEILETGPLNLQIGANEGQFMRVKIPELSPKTLGIREMNLTNQETAQRAITLADDAINMVSNVRSRIGAYQNRLEYTTANLSTASENLTASMSRIEDADMAYEMSQFTQKNIIAQAGNSMLAQANQRPQSLLQLLQRG